MAAAAPRPRRPRPPRGGSRRPRSAAAARRRGAVAVAVGLDDRAELGPAPSFAREQAAVALDRAGVDAGHRAAAPASRAHRRSAPPGSPRPRRRRSPTRRRRRARAASRPARGVGEHRGAGGREAAPVPRASSAAIIPERTSPGAGRRQRRARDAVDRDPLAVGDDRVVALQHDDRAAAARPPRGPLRGACALTASESTSSRRPSSPSCGVSTVGRLALAQLLEPAGVRVEPVGVDHQRRLDPLGELADQVAGPVLAADARARARPRRPARPPRGSARRAARRSRALAARAADRHHLGQLHLEDRLEVGGHGDGRVAGAGADRGARPTGRRRRSARASRPTTSTWPGAELGRARRRGAAAAPAPAASISPAAASAGAPSGIPIGATRSSPRAPLARRDPVPELGGVEGDGERRPRPRRPRPRRWRRRPRRRCRPRPPARRQALIASIAAAAGSRGLAREAGAEDRVDDRRRRPPSASASSPPADLARAPSKRSRFASASPESSSARPEQQRLDLEAGLGQQRGRRPARRRRCCPCRRRPRRGRSRRPPRPPRRPPARPPPSAPARARPAPRSPRRRPPASARRRAGAQPRLHAAQPSRGSGRAAGRGRPQRRVSRECVSETESSRPAAAASAAAR